MTKERWKCIQYDSSQKNTKKTQLGGDLLVIPNDPSNNLANNTDFMKALFQFQQGESEASDKAFEDMKKISKKRKKK